MEKPLLLCGLFLGLDIFEECSGFPVDLHSRGLRNAELWTSAAPFLAVAVLLCFVVLLAGCLCCRQTKGFQEFTDSTSSHSLSGTGGYVNNAASTTEFTIFPPLPPNVQQQRLSVAGQTPGDRSSVVRFEPLPDIKPPQPISRRPAAFNNAVSHGLSAQDWFEDPHANFPRHQLKYLRELGRGWFGRAVEGEAQGIVPGEKTSKVVVKILHEDATATDHMYFLHEVKPYRDLKHPNILKLLGRCLETDPFLVLLEACPSGDLKSFLSQNISTAEALSQQGVTLLMGCNIASGLQHMHQNGFVHTDLAARNCLVTSDLTVKIGDYGTSIETFKDDYYCAGEVALPIRWCAPETLFCTETTIETKEVTPGANVWNLGVVLWEICEFGKLPYSELTDDEVIVKVLGEGNHRLSLPSRSCLHRHNLYHLMRLCWSPASQRPALPQVLAMLNHLYTNREYANQDGDDVYNLKADEDFERRWETFKPNTIPKTDNHLVTNNVSVLQSPTKEASSVIPPVLVADNLEAEGAKEDQFLNEPKKLFILSQPTFDSMISPQDTSNTISDVNSVTPLTTSPQPSLTSSTGGEFFLPTLQHRHKSPSLQNLRGSLDDLCEGNGELNEVVEGSASEASEALKERQKRKSIDNVVVEEESSDAKMSVLDVRLQEESIGTLITEPEFDSWLQGVETTDEEDAKFVRKISEAIRDLDNALALEKTSSSSSSSEASSNSASHHQSPAKEVTPITSNQNVVLDFRLGPSSSHALSGVFSSKDVTFQPDSLQDDSLLERSLPREGNRATDSGTDTEDEMWRRRIECGEFSAKVKEKSKSVADLMVLTHIECSDGSDSDPPSPSWGFERNLNSRDSFSKQRRGSSNKTYNLNTSSGLAFGSEGNIHHAVLGEEFRHTLLKLHEALKDIKNVNSVTVQHQDAFENDPLLPQQNSVFHSSDPRSIIFPSHHHQKSDFLDIDASEIPKPTPEQVFCQSVSSEVLSVQNDRCISEDLLGSEHDNISVVKNNDVEHRSQVPEVEILVTEVVKVSDQEEKSVCDERNMGDCVRNEVCVEDMNENTSVCVKNLDESVHSNIPVSDMLETSSSLSKAESGRQEQILISDSVPQNGVVESAVSPTAKDDSTEGLQGNQEVSYTSESVSCSDISLFAPSDIFSELNDSELIDSSDIVNILEISPVKDNIFSPHPRHTSTPQNESILYKNNSYRSEEASCAQRNLEFEEPMSKITSDHDETQFSLSSIKPLDSSVGSFSDSSRAQTSTNFGTSTDSFEFITHPDSKDSRNESFSDPPAQRLELTKGNLLTHAFEESKPLSTERVEPEASVILGPCEEYTLDYFKGLKTTSEDNSLRVFDSEESNPEFSECDIPEIVENDFQAERINDPKTLVDKKYDFSHDIIPDIDNKLLIETHTSSPLPTSISSLENTDGNDNLPQNEKSLTCSFLENEIREEMFCRENKLVENVSIPTKISVEAESVSVDSQEETVGKSLPEGSFVNGDVFQDRLSLNSDLCVPSLNFIAATPLPSGRNSPELFVENGNDSNVATESVPLEASPAINGETSVVLNDSSEFCSSAVVREEPSVQSRISSELNVEELSAPAATDVRDVGSPVHEKAVNISFSSDVEPSLKGKSDVPVVASTSGDSSKNFNERSTLLNDSSTVILSHPEKDIDDLKNIEILNNEEFVHRLISSLSDLSVESKSFEAAPGIKEMEQLTGNVMESKLECSSPNEIQLSEDPLSPVDDNTKDSTSEVISESMSTVKSNLFECDTVQNSPDIVEGHLLSLVPEEETVDEVSVKINSILKEEKLSEDTTFDPLSCNQSSIIDQAVVKEAASLESSDANLTGQSNLLQLNENLAMKTCDVSVSSGSSEKIEVLSTEVNVQSVEPTINGTEGDLGILQLSRESPVGAKEHKDLLPVLKEKSVNEISSEGMECVVQEKNSGTNISNSGENNPALNETGSSQEMVSNLNSPIHNTDKISSSCMEKDMNNFRTSPLLNETVPQKFKTDGNEILTVVSPSSKELPSKDVSDVSNTTMPLSLHKIEEPNLPIDLTSVVTLPAFKQPDFEDNSLNDEKSKVCSESKQFCFTEAMDVFVKDIPGKTDDAVEKWKQQNIEILAEDFFQTSLEGKQYANKVLPVATDIGSHDFSSRFQVEESETAVELDDDGEDFGLDVAKHSTPDDERSSDSGFRDKGSLSESCEDACDEKYNLEDIEAELEETFNKGGFNYVVKGIDGEDDDLDHHHGGTDTSEDFRQSETPDGELDSTSSPIGMCGKLSPINQVDSSFCSGQKDKHVSPDHFAEKTVQDTSDEFDSESPLLKPNTHSLSVSNMNVLNSKSDYVDKISSSTPRRHHTPETPDLLNIEASDIPMPDLTVDQKRGIDDRYGISSPDDKTVPAKHKQPDFNSDSHTHSSFSEEKDLILDIGQTEFRAFSPEHNTNSFLDSSDLSPIRHMGGWFLHPPHCDSDRDEVKHSSEENNTLGDLMDDVFMSPKSSSSSISNGSKGDENNSNENYIPFNLDEEFVAAIRNELQEKLPCARQHSHDEPEDDGVIDPEDDLSQEERTDITIHYNVYPPPLSPILEERESVSSITTTISDNFCPFMQTTKETAKQDSDSEPASPVFFLDSTDPCVKEADAQRFEQEIREALENCSLSSAETDSSSDKGQQKTSVLVEDLEQPASDQVDEKHPSSSVTIVRDTFPQPDFDDDFLVVDTETNHATLLESPKPKSYLAFVNKRIPVNGIMKETVQPADFLDEKLTVSESSDGSFFLHARKSTDLNVESENVKISSDDEAFTPDSISPGQERQVHSSSSLVSSDGDNPSGNFVTPNEPFNTRLDLGLQIPAAYNPFFANSLATHYNTSEVPTYDVVEEISLGLPNNEAAEIISELESSGIFNNVGKESVQNDCSNETGEESSRTTTENDSEAISLEDNSDSLKSGCSMSAHQEKKSLSLNLPNLKQYSEQNSLEDSCSQSDDLQLSSVSIKLEESTDEANGPTRLLNDTLDLYKKKKASQKNDLSPTAEDKDWSVTSLEAALLSTKAPMPSPEEESWKQIPSMLAFSDLNEVISRCGDEDGFGEAMFASSSSPTYPPQENDDDLMSTSFSLKGDSDDLADCYTPDWESESEDTNDDDNNSSSSGEFIWKDGDREASVKAVDISSSNSTSKPYEGLTDFAMEVIEEEEEEDEDEDGSTSSGSGTEFVPSAWNSEATPNRSALRSPDKKVDQKKNVSFKKQKYHCVYEYPREVSDSESDGLDSPSRRRWELYQPDVDYASYADWELMEGDVPETANQDADLEPEVAESQGQSPQTFDFYKLSDVDYDFSTGVMPEEGEFYISSSARPFQFNAADSDIFCNNSSQFFPGQLYQANNVEDCSTNTTATSVQSKTSTLGVSVDSYEDEVDTSVPALSNSNKSSAMLGSQNSKAKGENDVETNTVENKPSSPKHIKDISFKNSTDERTEVSNSDNSDGMEHSSLSATNDRAKMAVSTVALTSRLNTLPLSYNAAEAKSLATCVTVDNNVEKELDFVETPSPSSPLSPTSGLGELRHTRDRLKLDLPASGSAFILDPPALSKRRSVEAVKGEASLLDSGEETEDSGIESSNGTTATSFKSQHTQVL